MDNVVVTSVSILRVVLPIGLIFLGGLASCLSLWVMPIILLQSNSSRSKIDQFMETFRRGGVFLQPASQMLAFLTSMTAMLTYLHPDPAIATTWTWYLAAAAAILQVAWYEVLFIFPINDQVAAMGDRLLDAGEQTLGEKDQKQLDQLIRSWQQKHAVRAALPFIAGCLAYVALL